MLRLSTGLKNYILDTGALKGAMDNGLIYIFSGVTPQNADVALDVNNHTLLCTISNNGGGTGVNFATSAVAGVLQKESTEVWKGTVAVTGTAMFYRHVVVGDDPTTGSTTAYRIQGEVGTVGKEMNLADVNLTQSAEQELKYYAMALLFGG